MFLNPSMMGARATGVTTVRRQRGFLIPLALFIVVVLGLLALALTRMTTQTGLGSAQELLSVQAFYAAESGAQRGMNHLFFPDATDRAAVNARCTGFNETVNFAGVSGLAACAAQVTCACSNCGVNDPTSFYTLTSIGRCGQGALISERTIRVGSYMERQ